MVGRSGAVQYIFSFLKILYLNTGATLNMPAHWVVLASPVVVEWLTRMLELRSTQERAMTS